MSGSLNDVDEVRIELSLLESSFGSSRARPGAIVVGDPRRLVRICPFVSDGQTSCPLSASLLSVSICLDFHLVACEDG